MYLNVAYSKSELCIAYIYIYTIFIGLADHQI